jgi:iron complex outermembrane recepter protein
MERWSMYTNIELDVNDYVKPYVQAMFTNYNALQELAATPAAGFAVPVTNPFIPADIAALAASRADPGADLSINKRFSDIGGRTGYNTHDVWQITAGTRGDITADWSYDFYASWGRSVRNEIQGGNIRLPQVDELLAAPDGGASICAGGLNFFGAAPISQACADYISLEAKQLTVAEQGVMEGVVTGNLFELPAGTVQSAFGASYRHLDYDFRPDSGLQPGIVAGFNEQLPVSGRLWYTDLFGEVAIPLVSDAPFMKSLSTTLGLRSTDNQIFGSDTTWKATFDWTMTDALRARGGFQRAIRSPNITELFSPQLNNFPNYQGEDPCNFDSSFRTGANAAQVQALCAAQAAVAGGANFVQPFGQAQAIAGGNPNLSPETADSWSAGLVVTPQFDNPLLERLSFTVDYFQMDLDDVISAVGTITIIQRCFNADNANPGFDINNEWCQLYDRDQADGRVINLQQLQRNQSSWEVRGADITANWGFGVGPGDLDFSLLASWLDSFKTQVTNVDPKNEFAGTISQVTGGSAPEWRGTLQTAYSMANWQVIATTRYISSMSHAALVTNPASTATGVDSTWYLDLSGRWDVTENLTLRAGINNVANQQPRLYSPNVQANTDPSLYDVLGRRFFVGFNYRL